MKRVVMPALVLRKSALSPMLATLPLIFQLTPLVSQLFVIIS
ncbi:hypothetical protein ACOD71_003267 [Escherichia coli]|nr:hypothetical protein [Escherichia coli]MCS7409996.1 hypothetical protein [Escherichia coli]MDD7878800.1 hypothetical protein [Escherichia coli]MDM8829408.1 hypothetical protein [Escherichia coli]MDM8843676.1 hypothetical protein [Escherichia coli]MDT8471534.1 hypothetical protein [Escherichia coli]